MRLTILKNDNLNCTLWSISDAGTTNATITDGNIFTATSIGTVTVRATIANGLKDTDYTQDFEITVSSGSGINDIQSNPLKFYTQDRLLYISGLTVGEALSIYSLTGTMVYQAVAASCEAIINLNEQGVYLMKHGRQTVKVIKN